MASANCCMSSSPWAQGLQLLGFLGLRRLRATVVTTSALLAGGAWHQALVALRCLAERRWETNQRPGPAVEPLWKALRAEDRPRRGHKRLWQQLEMGLKALSGLD